MAGRIKSEDILTVEQLNHHFKIYAGPGAGKTHFLVENIKNIIANNPLVARSQARKVLCITYTNAAADEIKVRLDRFSDSLEVYTIHGFIIEHIIKLFQQDLRDLMAECFDITIDTKSKITSQAEGFGILHGVDKEAIFQFIKDGTGEQDDLSYSKYTMSKIEVDNDSYLNNGNHKLSSPNKIAVNHVAPIKKYIWSIVKKLTHNEILYFGYRILEQNHTALYATRVKFPFIFIDEFQDTNPLQARLIKLIGEKSTVTGIIGDVAQSIYSFQGAKPSHFTTFCFDDRRILNEYVIDGNRRSTRNIVNFCNFIRQSDTGIIQHSIKPYDDVVEKEKSEEKKIHILHGDSEIAERVIADVIENGGAVLTRTWAAAFEHISDTTPEQKGCLKKIYNCYYNSPIDIRLEISELSSVTWVRAFKFIFKFWNAYKNGSLIEALRAFAMYVDFNNEKVTPKVISLIKKLSKELFEKHDTNLALTVDVINNFNAILKNSDYADLMAIISEYGFTVPIFEEMDKDDIIKNVNILNWYTSHRLFTEVFADGSRYMTVHQAKGREWDKVVVSIEPSKNDKNTLSNMFSHPKLLGENVADEFVRMYYVACSRAKEDLYIHLRSQADAITLKNALDAYNQANSNISIDYDVIYKRI